MDLSKLTPLSRTVGFAKGRIERLDGGSLRQEDADFHQLARAAFDVMMRRHWQAELWLAEGEVWGVDSAVAELPFELFEMRWPDPFTALVEADRWYRENVERRV